MFKKSKFWDGKRESLDMRNRWREGGDTLISDHIIRGRYPDPHICIPSESCSFCDIMHSFTQQSKKGRVLSHRLDEFSENLQTASPLALEQARKSSEDTLNLKKFGPGKLWVKKVWAQNILIDFLAELDHS